MVDENGVGLAFCATHQLAQAGVDLVWRQADLRSAGQFEGNLLCRDDVGRVCLVGAQNDCVDD